YRAAARREPELRPGLWRSLADCIPSLDGAPAQRQGDTSSSLTQAPASSPLTAPPWIATLMFATAVTAGRTVSPMPARQRRSGRPWRPTRAALPARVRLPTWRLPQAVVRAGGLPRAPAPEVPLHSGLRACVGQAVDQADAKELLSKQGTGHDPSR